MPPDPRTRRLLEGPIAPLLLKLAAPNMLVMVAQASAGLIETYFIGRLGTDALAGVSLVFPVLMLMQMMSAGAMGGGISSAVARALGGNRRADANALAVHALVIALGFGAVFTLAVVSGGHWLYSVMGGSGASLEAALAYSNLVFVGAVLVWLLNSLAAVIRGTGNMAIPAWVSVGGTLMLVPLSPLLIFGWGPLPALGIRGGAVALLLFYAIGSGVLAAYLWSGRGVLRPALGIAGFRRALFADILRVGLVATLVTASTNLSIAFATALAGRYGPEAIAGYGVGSRLEYLLVPLVFGLGAPLVALVGTNIGAGQSERALRSAWVGAGVAALVTEAIGLLAAAFPERWLTLFGADATMLEAGTQYLRAVGPFYGFFGLGLALYFASQGAGRLAWPVIANVARLVVAALGGWIAWRLGGGLVAVFLAQSGALIVFGVINAVAVAGGAWFQRGWRLTAARAA